MAMFIVKPWYGKKNPDDYFDPVTHIATEENFIKFLECGVYDSKYIGYKVQLGNSVDYNNGLWVIADVNHDSANTGQTNCYDLISQNLIHNGIKYGSDYSWRNSNPRIWLNDTFYPEFSTDLKKHIIKPKYNSEGTWYTDDYVIIPCKTELNGDNQYNNDIGIAYPIFTDNASRSKDNNYWWSRTSMNMYSNIWYIHSDGNIYTRTYTNSAKLAPILRVQ